jgi:hypothetical protein
MARGNLTQFWCFHLAVVFGIAAAWVEVTARWRVAGSATSPSSIPTAQSGGAGRAWAQPKAALQCRDATAWQTIRAFRGNFHQLADIHHRHAVGDIFHHAQVMRDEDIGQVEIRCSDCSRLSTCACTDTSRAETASSQTTSCGSSARARAMPMRWRWPPRRRAGSGAYILAASPPAAADQPRGLPVPTAGDIVDCQRLGQRYPTPSCAGSATHTGPGRSCAVRGGKASARLRPACAIFTTYRRGFYT